MNILQFMRDVLCILILCSGLSLLGIGSVQAAENAEAALGPDSVEQALADLTAGDRSAKKAAVNFLMEHKDISLLPKLEEIRLEVDRRTRRLLKPLIDILGNEVKLVSPDSEVRRGAARDLGMRGGEAGLSMLEAALEREEETWVRYDMEEAVNLIKLEGSDDEVRLAAIARLGEMRSANALPALEELVKMNADDPQQQKIAQAAGEAVERINSWQTFALFVSTTLRGISLSSVFLMMAMGLAIVFGLMGVINMAHGEMMMVGGYAAFVTQEIFRAYLPEGVFDYYYAFALPVSFLAAGLLGYVLEVTLIRFLYGRPLETLLLTWGVGLIMIQAARVTFGDLTSVQAPQLLRGSAQVAVGIQLPYNRIFVVILALVSILGIYWVLFRTAAGLRVRAVMQNRNMSACLGIPTRKLDSLTFAFGSGMAGLAGCALTLIGNVEPEMGRQYIVDSFMVVVTGGVGKLAGTISAAFGLGMLNKYLEPFAGAVYGKVFILLLIILFLQYRPAGLFVIKGRYADS